MISTHFLCPYCRTDLENGALLSCPTCRREYPIENGVVRFVEPDELDAAKLKELNGNEVYLAQPDYVERMKSKGTNSYYDHIAGKKLDMLAHRLRSQGVNELASLGCGIGYDVRQVLKRGVSLRRLFLSDLSFEWMRLVPEYLSDCEVETVLFTSDLDLCPLKGAKLPILVYEALHHTPDMHAALERLLKAGYESIYLMEPTNNFVIRSLEKRGLSQRIEYSSLKPGRLEIKTIKNLAKDYGYNLNLKTLWEFPEDYFDKLRPFPERLFLSLVDLFSLLGRPFNFGNMTFAHLEKGSSSD